MPPPRPHRRIRRITLPLGMAAALAALVLMPLSRHGTAQTPLNGNLDALVSASDGGAGDRAAIIRVPSRLRKMITVLHSCHE